MATQSDDSSLGLDDIGLNRPQMSKDLQEVYESLMNFQKRDTSSFSSPVIKPSKYDKDEAESSPLDDDKLSDILAAYGVRLETDKPKRAVAETKPKKGEYFIPVDYETFCKWKGEQQKPPSVPKQPEPRKDFPTPEPRHLVNQISDAYDDPDGGDDTSQDAADLETQESNAAATIDGKMKDEPIEAQVNIIGHPDEVKEDSYSYAAPIAASASEHKRYEINDEVLKMESDVKFVMESDNNADEKLYSSESESIPKAQKRVEKKSTTAAALNLSSSSSKSSKSPSKVAKKDAPKVMTLQIQSESESNDAKNAKDDDDLSGPEVEDVDDFWN